MKISWTPKARRTYFEVIEHLEKAWIEREIQNFINEVDHLLEQIEQNPEKFEESRKKKNVRKGLVTKQNTLYYPKVKLEFGVAKLQQYDYGPPNYSTIGYEST